MGIAEGKIDIRVGLAKDMRHIGIVAHDLNRGGDTRNDSFGVIVGQGPRGEIIGQRNRSDAEQNQSRGKPDKPAKNQRHRILGSGWSAPF